MKAPHRVNYFDLGLHSGLELRYVVTQILTPAANKKLIDFQAYGFEACEAAVLFVKHQLQLKPNSKESYDSTTIIHKAISNTQDKIKLYYTDREKQPEGAGNSIFRTKNNVTDKYEEVQGVIFSKWLKENVPNYDKHFNILKVNIEGAEWHLFNDMVDNDILQHFPVILGSGHDVDKVSELDSDKYWKLIKDNNINIHRFTVGYHPEKNADILRLIKKEFKLWKKE
jgi:hypothetical protein